MNELLTDWLTNRVWKTDRLPDCLTNGPNWLSDWLTYRPSLTNWLNVWQTDRTDWLTTWEMGQTDCLTDWRTVLLTEWLTNITALRFYRISEKLTVSPTDWLIEGQTDWLTDKLLDLPGDTRLEWLIGDILLTDWGKQWICGRGAQSGWLNDCLAHWPSICMSNWSGWS